MEWIQSTTCALSQILLAESIDEHSQLEWVEAADPATFVQFLASLAVANQWSTALAAKCNRTCSCLPVLHSAKCEWKYINQYCKSLMEPKKAATNACKKIMLHTNVNQ